jgi:hypothetical protein
MISYPIQYTRHELDDFSRSKRLLEKRYRALIETRLRFDLDCESGDKNDRDRTGLASATVRRWVA